MSFRPLGDRRRRRDMSFRFSGDRRLASSGHFEAGDLHWGGVLGDVIVSRQLSRDGVLADG